MSVFLNKSFLSLLMAGLPSLGNKKLPFERIKEKMVGRFEDEEKALLEK